MFQSLLSVVPIHAQFRAYLTIFDVDRGLSDGPLFSTYDSHTVSRKLFTDYLARISRMYGLNPTKYKGHSFRIGAATFARNVVFLGPVV